MDPTTASYYRSILFRDSQDQRGLPPTLVLLHAWAFKRWQAMGAGSIISKQAALGVAMTWMSSTREGRAFAMEHTTIGEMFSPSDRTDDEALPTAGTTVVDWDAVRADAKVVVVIDDKPTIGEYIGRRSSWIDVRIAGDRKSFRANQVQLAGA